MLFNHNKNITDSISPDIELRIEAEQIRHIYNQTPVFVPVVMLSSFFVTIMFWPITSPLVGILWCVWIWVVYISLWGLCKRWKKAQPDDASMKAWAKPYIILGWVATASWGIIGVLFFYVDSLNYQALLLIILIMGAAAVTTTSTAYSPTFYSAILLLLPLLWSLISVGQLIQYLLAIGVVMFSAMMFLLHRNSHALYTSALKLRFINEEMGKQLAMQKNIAEHENISKSKFLAAASHDLRQPLHAMSLFHGELCHSNIDEKKQNELIANIGASIVSMSELLSGLLETSRFEVGVVEANFKFFQVNELFDDLCHEYYTKSQVKNLRFKCVPCSIVVFSDPLLLRRIVCNLLENAIQYTNNGSILLGCRRKGDALSLQVWDTGMGIATEDLRNIFDEFKQLDNPDKDQSKGLGLGLSVVKQLSNVLNHNLSVESVLGKGSMFSLQILLNKDNEINVEKRCKQANIVDNLKSSYMLVIDDDENIRKGMKELLTSWGCEVMLAFDLNSAVNVIESSNQKPNVIISDYHLEDSQTGIEIIKKLRLKYAVDFPSILISADNTLQNNDDVMKSNIMFLHKPVNAARLVTSLRFLMANTKMPNT